MTEILIAVGYCLLGFAAVGITCEAMGWAIVLLLVLGRRLKL